MNFQTITLEGIMGMEKVPRLNLVNTISGFKSANLIGTVNSAGINNLAIFSSVIHLGSNPPLMGFITRPTVVPRHTYLNIKETGHYTINHIHYSHYKMAHQTSANYDKEISEFEECGFTPEYTNGSPAPYVKESVVKMGLKFEEEHHIKANDTILVVGKIIELVLPENVVQQDGFLDLEALGTVAISGLEAYHQTHKIARLSYARPNGH